MRQQLLRRIVTLVVLSLAAAAALAQSDIEPPELFPFDFNPRAVDVASGPAVVTCDMHWPDSPARTDWARDVLPETWPSVGGQVTSVPFADIQQIGQQETLKWQQEPQVVSLTSSLSDQVWAV